MNLKRIIRQRVEESGARFFYVGRAALRKMNAVRGDEEALHFRGWYYDMPHEDDFFGGFTSPSAAIADCYEKFCQGSRPEVQKNTLRAAVGLPPSDRKRTPAWDRRSLAKADRRAA